MPEIFNDNIFIDYTFRIFVSFLCGFLLGFERKTRLHAVGVRTLVLICTSSALLGIVSILMADQGPISGDPTRIAAGVVTGIGFIGGGTILRQGFNIRGITTAAVIFVASAIGLSCGAGYYFPALLTLLISLFILYVVEKVEHKFFPAGSTKVVHLEFNSTSFDEKTVFEIFKKYNMTVLDTDFDLSTKHSEVLVSYMVKAPNELDYQAIGTDFSKLSKLVHFQISKK